MEEEQEVVSEVNEISEELFNFALNGIKVFNDIIEPNKPIEPEKPNIEDPDLDEDPDPDDSANAGPSDSGPTASQPYSLLKSAKLTADEYQDLLDKYEADLEEYNKLKDDYDKEIRLISLLINMICREIKIKTNRQQFPEDLIYLVINMVSDAYSLYKSNKDTSSIETIQSMSEAGRSVNFGIANTLQTKINLLVQKQISDNEKQINRYRLLYRVGGINDKKD